MDTKRYSAALQRDKQASAEMTRVRALVRRLKILKTRMQSTLARFDAESSGTIPMRHFDQAVSKIFSRAKRLEKPDWEVIKRHYETDGSVLLSEETMEMQFRYRPFIVECYREDDPDEALVSHSVKSQVTKFKVGSNVKGRSKQ